MRYQEIVGKLILAATDAGLMMYDTRDEIELNDILVRLADLFAQPEEQDTQD